MIMWHVVERANERGDQRGGLLLVALSGDWADFLPICLPPPLLALLFLFLLALLYLLLLLFPALRSPGMRGDFC